MASILDLDASSDSENDGDYVPPEAVEGSSDSSAGEISDDDLNSEKSVVSSKIKRKRGSVCVKRNNDEKSVSVSEVVSKLPVVDEKKRANDLWASFLEDVKVDSKKNDEKVAIPATVRNVETKIESARATSSNNLLPKKEKEPTVEKVFEFAGETFTISQSSPENLVDKGEIAETSSPSENANVPSSSPSEKANVPSVGPPKRKGLDSILGMISNGKKQKLTTLDKTLLDWKTFKQTEGLEYDLERFNKGRAGYLERQKFLQRSDVRSFELEKSMRQAKRKK